MSGTEQCDAHINGWDRVHYSEARDPEPQKDEYLLIEHINSQNALNGMDVWLG